MVALKKWRYQLFFYFSVFIFNDLIEIKRIGMSNTDNIYNCCKKINLVS